jgi:hypothetical protein
MKIILCSEVDDVFIPKDRVFTTEKCLSNSYKHMHLFKINLWIIYFNRYM